MFETPPPEQEREPVVPDNRFPIEAVQAALKNGEQYQLLNFTRIDRKTGQQATFDIKVFKFGSFNPTTVEILGEPETVAKAEPVNPNQEYRCTLRVYNVAGEEVGHLSGRVLKKGDHYVLLSVRNSGEGTAHYVPGIVADSIVELVVNDVFEICYSGKVLTEEGNAMFESMQKSPRVIVQPDSDLDGAFRWKITKKS